MKFSKLTDYAVIILTALQHRSLDNSAAASVLAKETNLPEPTVSKVLKMLSRHQLVTAQRGALGGYSLKRDLSGISVFDVLIAIEGPLTMTECVSVETENCCSLEAFCALSGRWNIVNQAVENALRDISLVQLTAPMNQVNHKTIARG